MITLSNIDFRHAPRAKPLHFDLRIAQGEKVAIVGASGAGKSTLLSLIAGFAIPERGDIWLNGEKHTQTAPHRRPVSILFQNNNLFNHLTVEQNIAIGIAANLKLAPKQRQSVHAIAAQVGLNDYLSRLPDKLSGGQQQRVALARCLLRDKPILLLDEPFSALDKDLRAEMLALLRQLCTQQSLTVLLVTHQPEEIAEWADRCISIFAP